MASGARTSLPGTWLLGAWLLAAGLALAGGAGLALAQTAQQVEQAERARAAQQAAQADAEARARAAGAEEQRLAAERVAAAASLRRLEATTAAEADRVADLAGRRRAAEERLRQSATEMAPLLPLMERLALYPAETLLAVPLSPEQSVRGLLVLGTISRELEADAAAARAEQAEAARLKAAGEAELPQLASAEAAQARAAADLDSRVAAAHGQRQAAQDEAADAARQAAAAATRADSLRGALAQLEAARRAAEEKARGEAEAAQRQKRGEAAAAARQRELALARPAGPGLGEPNARLTSPVAGSVARGWGDTGDEGTASGVTIRAAPRARVVSPCTGRVVFANPFRSYGMLMIVDCGGGWHAVLAGLDRFDVTAGAAVEQGEPVGTMAGWDPRGDAPRPSLYLELRRNGHAVDPTPYLRAAG